MTAPPTVVVSILNWNCAELTLRAVRSVLDLRLPPGVRIETVVLDNGSRDEDARALAAGLQGLAVRRVRVEANLGFTGGHNRVLAQALRDGAEFVWLLNSDSVASPDCLGRLLARMAAQPRCGAASPLIVRLGRPERIDSAGAVHEWGRFRSTFAADGAEADALVARRPGDFWVAGTAILLRSAALREVGLLDDHYFAYFDDNDICARLAQAGWHSAVAADACVEHACFDGDQLERPPYYFYLMTRNSMRFWVRHVPRHERRWLRLRLVEHWLFFSNRLHRLGHAGKRDACLLGLWDGLQGVGGPPRLERRAVPFWLRGLRALRERNHRAHLEAEEA